MSGYGINPYCSIEFLSHTSNHGHASMGSSIGVCWGGRLGVGSMFMCAVLPSIVANMHGGAHRNEPRCVVFDFLASSK